MKKLFIITIILCVFIPKAHASVYINQSTTTVFFSGATNDLILSAPVKQGSLLYLCVQIVGIRQLSVTDNMNNNWIMAASTTSVTAARQMYVLYVKNAAAGFTTITLNSGSSIGKRVVGREYVGIDPVNTFNASSTNSQDAQTYGNTGTVSSTGSLLTSCFGITAVAVNTTISPWANRLGQPDTGAPNVFTNDIITSSSTPSGYTSWATSQNYTSALITFNVASVPKYIFSFFTRFKGFMRI